MRRNIGIQQLYQLQTFFTTQISFKSVIQDHRRKVAAGNLTNDCRPNSSAWVARQAEIAEITQMLNYDVVESGVFQIGCNVFWMGKYTPFSMQEETRVYLYNDNGIYTTFMELLNGVPELLDQLQKYLRYEAYRELEQEASQHDFNLDVIRHTVFKTLDTDTKTINIDKDGVVIEQRYDKGETHNFPIAKLKELTPHYDRKEDIRGWDADGYPIKFEQCKDMDFYWFYIMYVEQEGRPQG